MRKNILFTALFVFVFILAGCGSLSEDITPPPGSEMPTAPPTEPVNEQLVFPVLPPDPARGASIYTEKCAPCHGSTGLGDGPDADDLPNPVAAIGSIELSRTATSTDWYLMVANGNIQRYMPPFKSLSVPQRWDVIAYVFSLNTSDEVLAQGQALFEENCAACHGEYGQGDGPQAGELSSSPIDFTDQAYMGYKSATDLFDSISGGMGEMHAFSDLGEADRWALTDFLRSLTFVAPEALGTSGDVTTPEDESSDATSEGAESSESTTQPAETPSEVPAESADPAERVSTVFVQVVNGSGGDLPVGTDVILHGYDGMEESFTQTATLNEEGFVFFEEIPMPEGRVFLATTEHEQVAYGSDIFQVSPENIEADLSLMIFDSTTDTSNLAIERLHVFFDFINPGSVQVIELVLLSNMSGETVAAPDDNPVIEFELPEGAINLEVQESMQLRLLQTEDGFGVGSVRPSGEPYDITFAFEMPYDKKKADISLPVPLDAAAAIIIAPEDGVKLKSDQLQDGGSRDFQGIPYRTYNANNIKAGDSLTFTLSGTPKLPTDTSASAGTDTTTSLMIGLGALGVVLIGTGIYLWQRNRIEDDDWDIVDADDLDDESRTVAETQEELMDAIIALDDLYKAGDLPEAAYLKRRDELKSRLHELVSS
ncbi:MAG: c-type cytochrome [Anaerolineales bacterium]|nr:c-type cytochrome [Chloroflexota bacterium]MBL6979636.1 c-type cytochrome [Anaerolineales bacterium]